MDAQKPTRFRSITRTGQRMAPNGSLNGVWNAWAGPSLRLLKRRRPDPSSTSAEVEDGGGSSRAVPLIPVSIKRALKLRSRRLYAAATGACCALLLACHLLWPRIVVSSYWRWLHSHGPLKSVLYVPPIVYQSDGHTPDWDRILEPPRLRRQVIHVREAEIQRGVSADGSVRRNTLTTGAEAIGAHAFQGMVFPFECMFAYLPRRYAHKPMLIRLNDVYDPAPYPVLAKARSFRDENAVLIPIDYQRFFNSEYLRLMQDHHHEEEEDPFDTPFRDKAPRAIWRGATSDWGWDPKVPAPSNTRRVLLEQWGSDSTGRVDVGLSVILGEPEEVEAVSEYWRAFVKGKMAAEDQLRNRYLISVEGNDVGTGLRWMLASQSVVLMVPPRREIWSRESLLQPWVHYIPLRPDFSDLLGRIDWCEAHLEECEAISQRATAYVRGFNDTQKACRQGAARVKEYLEKVTVVVVP